MYSTKCSRQFGTRVCRIECEQLHADRIGGALPGDPLAKGRIRRNRDLGREVVAGLDHCAAIRAQQKPHIAMMYQFAKPNIQRGGMARTVERDPRGSGDHRESHAGQGDRRAMDTSFLCNERAM
jgi:hypothetical protein